MAVIRKRQCWVCTWLSVLDSSAVSVMTLTCVSAKNRCGSHVISSSYLSSSEDFSLLSLCSGCPPLPPCYHSTGYSPHRWSFYVRPCFSSTICTQSMSFYIYFVSWPCHFSPSLIDCTMWDMTVIPELSPWQSTEYPLFRIIASIWQESGEPPYCYLPTFDALLLWYYLTLSFSPWTVICRRAGKSSMKTVFSYCQLWGFVSALSIECLT